MVQKAIWPVLAATAFLLAWHAGDARAEAAFCLPGSGPGQCSGQVGVAVDNEGEPGPAARVYVADRGNNRVGVFKASGAFVKSFGEGILSEPTWVAVDNGSASASRHDIYVTNGSEPLIRKYSSSGSTFTEVASFGKVGSGPCEFAPNRPIAIGPGGNIYVAASVPKGINNFESKLLVFSPSGSCLEEVALFEAPQRISALAVDSNGNIYVSNEGIAVSEFAPNGVLVRELDPGGQAEGLAVDPAGNLFAKQQTVQKTKAALIQLFTEFPPTGTEPLRRFSYFPGNFFAAPGLAASSGECDLYASEGAERGIRCLTLPPPGPVAVPEPCRVKSGALGNTKATLQAELNPEGEETTFKFEYATGSTTKSTSSSTLPADFELHEATIEVGELEPETTYHCRVVAENASSTSPMVGEEGEFTTRPGFEFGPAWSSSVQESSAVINVEGDPLGVPATGQVEYVTDAQYQAGRFTEAQTAPTPELEFGNGEGMQLRSVALTGLAPGTLYHFRLRARNGTPPQGVVCPEQKENCSELEHTFRTYLPEAQGDHRGHELVSPGEKNTAEVATPSQPSGLFEPRSVRLQAAAGSGEAITYTSFTSFGSAEGSAGTNQYLSRRTEEGWSTKNISPSGFLASPLIPPLNGFTPDLGFGIFKITEPPLTPDCQKATGGSIPENIYLRNLDTGALQCLDPGGPGGPEGIPCLLYGGMSEGGGRVFIAGTPKGGQIFTYSLYEWTPQGLHPVSILPNGEPAPASEATAFGRSVSKNGVESCSVGLARLRNAVSADGSRVFWTYVPEAHEPSQLLVRLSGVKTLQLDAKPAKKAGAGPFGNGVFQAASSDGSVTYFTDTGRLVSGSKAEVGEPGKADLYRYEVENESEPLTDLTKGAVPGDVQGVIGASDDGAYVYFVARGALTGEEEGSIGEKAQQGADNLYVFHEGQSHFIATLAAEDQNDWSVTPQPLSARLTPDGKHLAFLSVEAQKLAGYDNARAQGEHCQYELTIESNARFVGSPLCAQAFIYSAEDGKVTCASCNPSGARPLGPTILPGWTNPFEGPRYLSDNGSRFFFQSFDSLLPADVNGEKSDVYEFELAGEGTCDAANPNFDSASGGCHFLVSSGKSDDESYLVDASATGHDVFFSTRQRLVGWDMNDNFDVYDYREGGGFREPVEHNPCPSVAGCRPPSSPAPPAASPPTSGFAGPGNPKPTKPKRHKKKHGKHSKKKHGKKKHGKRKGAGR